MTKRHLLFFVVIVLSWLLPYKAFSQNYTIINDATQLGGCNCYRLTPDQQNQGGGVYQNNTINLNNSFDYIFNVFLGCGGASGADGIVFILTNNITSIGAQGGGLGYSGLGGNSLACEFDTWQNGWDPPYDHIAFESGGNIQHNVAGPVAAIPSQANMDDCAWHTAEIVWNVNTQTYSVYFDGVLRLTYTGNIVSAFFNGNPIVNWGWSGSTGGGSNDQRFCVNSISDWVAGTNYQSCNLTMQFTDISTSNVGSVSSWKWHFGEPSSGASDSSSLQNPTHTYAATGTYNVTLIIKDVGGCSDTFSHIVTIAPQIAMTPTITEPPCNGGANGDISISSSGGFGAAAGYGGYSYTWSNSPNHTGTDVGLTAGTYNVTVTDGVCTTTASYTLTQPSPLVATTSHTDAPCGANGSVHLSISGGTPPYYGPSGPPSIPVWNGVPGYNQTGLPPAVYVANFIDANGCSALLEYKETIAALPCGYTVSASSTDVTCFGNSNGTATLTVTGGTNPIVISWTNSAGTTVSNVANATGLPADTYTYHYSDGSGHTFTGTVVVHQPGAAMVAGITTTNTTCSYLNDGSAVASVTANGTPGYSYVWSPAHPNSPTASNLSPGPISVTITDANGCTATASGTVTGQTALSPSVTTVNDSCYLARKGSATVTVTGGTPVYSYLWSNSSAAIGSTDYYIGQGTYTVTVTDQNHCTATASGVVGQPTALTETMTHVNVLCFGNNTGSATITPVGGNGGYVYTWSPSGSAATNSPLTAGTYYVTVTDAKNCVVNDSVTITQPAAAFTVTPAQVNVKCKGAATGSITLTLAGGTTPYGTVTWSGGATGTTRTNLTAGSYTYTATDANSCTVTGTVTITEPASAFTVGQSHVNVLCFGNSTGSLILTPAGGTTPYAIPEWLDLTFGTTRNNLPAGTYIFGDSDNNGCLVIDSVIITQPASAFNVSVAQVNVLCKGGATGSITLTLSGGTTPYGTVNWTGGATGTSRTNLTAGSYSYTVNDANNCPQSGTVSITEPATAFTATPSQVNVLCKGDATGSITLTLAGGTTPYGTVTWTGGATGTTLSNLTAGSYTYTVADANNCPQTGTVTITEPATAFSVTSSQVNVLCFGNNTGSITLTLAGGTTPYGTVTWAGGATGTSRTNLVAGSYDYTATDANNCTQTGTITITQPLTGGMTVNVTPTSATCSYTSDGSAVASVTGGVSPYDYSWSNSFTETGVVTSTATGLSAITYTVTVTDQNTCTALGTTTVGSPPAITAQIVVTDVSCFGGNTGDINVTAGGGSGGFTYTWSPNAATGNQPDASNLVAGLYNLTITDVNNCVLDTFATVGQPVSALTFATPVFVQNVSCNGGSNGEIKYVVSGGTAPYSFTWSGSAAGSPDSAVNLAAGSYDVTITDSKLCTVTNTEPISEPSAMAVVSQSQTNVTCNGGNDGTAIVNITGGTLGGGYIYTWNPNAGSTNTVTGLAAGPYTVTATDNNQCTISANFNITAPPPLTATPAETDVSCNNGSDGSITITAGGGTPAVTGYTYTWNPNVTATNASSTLTAGSYSITVTDSVLCTTVVNVPVGQPTALVPIVASVTNISCSRDSDGQIQLSASGGISPYQYALSPDGVTFTSSPTGLFTNLKIGNYTGRVTDAHGCINTIPVSITAPDSVTVTTVIDTVKCYGEQNGAILVSATGGTPGYTFTFSNGVVNNSGNNLSLAAGTYAFTVTDSRGCAQTYSTVIYQPDSLEIFCTPAHPVIDLTQSIDLQASSNATTNIVFTWSPTIGLSNTEGSNTTVTTYNNQIYTLTGTINPHGEPCVASIQVPVTVIPNYNVYIPNTFTPNGDGINDYFEFFSSYDKKAIKLVEVEVFDRWGEKVFQSTDIDFKWDGTYKGTKLEPGVYVYQMSIVFVDNHAESGFKGTITVLR